MEGRVFLELGEDLVRESIAAVVHRQHRAEDRERLGGAGALDDPKAWIALSNVPVRSWSFREEDMTGKEIGLSQMFPYPGKRGHAVQIVTREKEQAEFELEEMRNMLRADVKMAYAELASIRPQAGGEYVYLREGFGRPAAFLTGWTSFVAGFTGAIAASAVALADYMETRDAGVAV